MGFNIGWIATRGKAKAAVLQSLNMKDTGVPDPYMQEDFSGAELSGGWYNVIDGQTALVDRFPILEQLSTGARTLSVAMLEGPMLSYAAEWVDGRQLWSIMHDASTNPVEHLDVTGNPPREFAEIRDKHLARQREQRGADYVFEIPLELAGMILPFRPDRLPMFFGPKFTSLRPA